MGPTDALQLVIYFVLLAFTAYRAARILRRTRAKVQADFAPLAAWARAHGWRCGEGSDPEFGALADEASALLAEVGRRSVGAVLIGKSDAGPIVIAETWRDDESLAGPCPSVDVSYATKSHGTSTMLVVDPQRHTQFNPGAPKPPQAVFDAIDGLPPGSQISVLPDRLLLRRPGFLAPEQITWLVDRLAKLDAEQLAHPALPEPKREVAPAAPLGGSPYREAPSVGPRYLCIVCFKTATTRAPGVCPCANAPRLPIDNPEVTDELRKHVAKVHARKMARTTGAAVVAGVLVAIGVEWADGWEIYFRFAEDIAVFAFLVFLIPLSRFEPEPPKNVAGMLRWLKVTVVD